SLKTYTDYQNTIDTAFMEGEIKGKMEGKEEGRVVGKVEEKEIVTVNLLKKGMTYDFIEEVTGLSFEEIEKIKKKYNL
ncbi:MAG: hypothetical protein EAZ85_15110, partial [Bacteroidetes bacterium]